MNPKAIVFDLDDTLTESKQPLDAEMASLIEQLLEKYFVGVMSGGSFEQYQKQFISHLPPTAKLEHLFVLPTSGGSLYTYENNEWHKQYQTMFSEEEAKHILSMLEKACGHFNIPLETEHGKTIENRGSQITISPLGQQAPVELKRPWDPDQKKRKEIVHYLGLLIPDCTITIGGMTSIDITPPGVDKAYGVLQASQALNIPVSDMVYIGDKLEEGGNDYPVRKSGIKCIETKDVAETKTLIRGYLK